MPDAYWNAERGVAFDKLIPDLTNLTAFKAAEDSRRAAVPEKADAYKLALPQDHKLPEGVDKFEFDQNDPRLPKLREWAHSHGIDQGSLSELLAVHADYEIGQQQMLQTARQEQAAKLGANGPARVTALGTWLKAQLGDQRGGELLDRMVLHTDIAALEDLMRKFSTQGVNGFSQQHRENPPAQQKTLPQKLWPKRTATG